MCAPVVKNLVGGIPLLPRCSSRALNARSNRTATAGRDGRRPSRHGASHIVNERGLASLTGAGRPANQETAVSCRPAPGHVGSRADPTVGVSLPAGVGRLPRVLDQRELTGLLDGSVPESEHDWRRRRDDAAVPELLYGSGLREGELCAMQVSSLSLASGAATVWGKGSKERGVPVSEPAERAVRSWLALRLVEVRRELIGPIGQPGRRRHVERVRVGVRNSRRRQPREHRHVLEVFDALHAEELDLG